MNIDGLLTSQFRDFETRCANEIVEIARDGGKRTMFPETSLCERMANANVLGDERLAERTRIAQELHDTLLQGFLGVAMQLHAAVDGLPTDCAEKKRFSEILLLVDRALDEGRCALQGLRSPNEHGASLGEAFARVPNDFGFPSATGFRVVVLGKEKELRAGLVDDVYRIGCEAILNACRHSQARDIEAEIEYRPTELRIAVRDNGCGIGPQDLDAGKRGHWGLQGMRERAERIGAGLHLWSRVTLGTEVELRVPGWVAFEQVQG
jgi:signal transduction histidine kinase